MLRDVRSNRRTECRINRRAAIRWVGRFGLVPFASTLGFSIFTRGILAHGADTPETLRLFSRIEPSLGDVWGQASVVSRLAVVPSSATTRGTVELLAAGDDHRLRLWRLSLTEPVPPVDTALLTNRIPGQSPPIPAHQPLWTRERGTDAHEDWIRAVAVSPDGRRAVTGDASGRILFWTIGVGGVPDQKPRVLQSRGSAILAAAFRPDSAECAVAGDGGQFRIFRIPVSGTVDAAPTTSGTVSGVRETIRAVSYSPDGQWLAECGDSGEVRVRRSRSGEVVSRWMTIAGRRLRDIAFSPDGKRLAVAGDTGIVYVAEVDPQKGAISKGVAFPRYATRMFSIVWCGDDQLATGSSDGLIRIHDVAFRQTVAESELGGHDGTITTLVWLPEARTLVSSGYDTTIRLWHIGREA